MFYQPSSAMKKIILIIAILINNNIYAQALLSIKIGNQIWSHKNYDRVSFRNGDKIKEIKSKEEWLKAGFKEEPAWCYFDFDSTNASLGKLYNYFAISDKRNIAPEGWKVPTLHDYYTLINFLDPLCTKRYVAEYGSLAWGSLKIKNKLSWEKEKCLQITSNFDAIPAGGYSPEINSYTHDWDKKDESSNFWCITKWELLEEFIDVDKLNAFKEFLKSNESNEKGIVIRLVDFNCKIEIREKSKINGYSIRLVKEN